MENQPNNCICPTCGASTKSFIHSLTPGLVSVLVKAIKYVHEHNKNDFHFKDLDLSYTEASNLQKLRFHALLAHADKENTKSGHWIITTRGGQFLRGETRVPKKVKTFRNKVIGVSHETIHINDLKHDIPYFESQFAYETKSTLNINVPVQSQLL